MIRVIPAIDIIEGRCVRLTEGDYRRQTTYDCDVLEMAQRFEASGCTALHVVDLDGARLGELRNLAVLERIAAATSLAIDFSGGIRSQADVARCLEAGATQVAIGSLAASHPEVFCMWLEEFGAERLILSADVRAGRIAVRGWQEVTELEIETYIASFLERSALRAVTVTDISKDGLLGGPSLQLYSDLRERFPELHICASGGVSSLADLRSLEALGVDAVIVGKALYEGKISLGELEGVLCSQSG